MNHPHFTSISLNGHRFQRNELPSLCKQKIADSRIPGWERNIYGFIQEWISATPTLTVRTSGSTGEPKWITIEKDKMVHSAMATGNFFQLHKNNTALLCLPVDFIAGKMMVVRAFVLGLDLYLIEPSGNPLKNTSTSFDFAAMTPMQVSQILESPEGSEKLGKISRLIIGGADIHPEVLTKIRAIGNATWQTYGMTETLTHVALRKLNPPGESECYSALPRIHFMLDDRNCLVISAPDLQKSVIITNDMVELISDKEFKFKGRYDNVINSGGIKLSPEEIESKLYPFLPHRFIVAGIPDEKLGQKLILVIEGREEEPISLSELAAKANLAKFEVPKQVMYTGSFPTTENGKIIRSAMLAKLPTYSSNNLSSITNTE